MNIAVNRLRLPIANPFTQPPTVPVDESELPPDTVTIGPSEIAEMSLNRKARELKRPLILVNGLARDAHEWDKLVPWLGSNPKNSFAGVYRQGADAEFTEALKRNPDARIFVLNPSNNLASPRILAEELRRMVDHIVRHTDAEKVDVVGHSQGGLDILAAVQQGEDRFENVIGLATPWKGAAIASLARVFDHSETGLVAPLGKDRGALLDLRPISQNPWLKQAHRDLQKSSDKPKFFSLTGSGTPTPDTRGVAAGDGFVTLESGLGLDGAKNYHFASGDWKPGEENFRAFSFMDINHLGIVGNSRVFHTLDDILSAPGSELRAGSSPEFSEASSASIIESNLNIASDKVHDLLRQDPGEPFGKWVQDLDSAKGIRQSLVTQQLVGSEIESRKKWSKRVLGLGVAATVAGGMIAGPLGSLPGVALACSGGFEYLEMRRLEKSQLREIATLEGRAKELRQDIEARLPGEQSA